MSLGSAKDFEFAAVTVIGASLGVRIGRHVDPEGLLQAYERSKALRNLRQR